MPEANTMLPGDPASVPVARRFVESTLVAWGYEHLVEPARLCVSELVTNVVLHARGPFRIVLCEIDGRLHVDVTDGSPHLPRPKQYDVDAATGRGLHLVEFVALAWGSEPTDEGKRVWFELPLDGTVSTNGDSGSPRPLVTVHVTGLPLDLYEASAAHADEVMRELQLLAASVDRAPLPSRLLVAGEKLAERFRAFTQAQEGVIADAVAAGASTIDLTYQVPVEAAYAARSLARLWDEVDEFCRHEEMLTLASPPEVVTFRRWYYGEFVNQIGGAAPQAWPAPEVSSPSEEATKSLWAIANRLASLQQLTARLARAMDRDDVVSAVLEQGLVDLGARTGSLCLLTADGRELEIVGSTGYAPEVVAAWERFSIDDDLPASEAVRTGLPIFLETTGERDRRYEAFQNAPVSDNAASAIVPLTTETGSARGVITIGFDSPHPFDEADRRFLVAIADQCAIALERVELAERVTNALESAEHDRTLLATLLERAPIGLAFFDLGGRFVQVNATLAEMDGVSADAHAGRRLRDVVPSISEHADTQLREVLQNGQPLSNQEFSLTDPVTQHERHWLVSWYPVRGPSQETVAVGAVIVDITARKEAERNLSRLLNAERAARVAADETSGWLERLELFTEEPLPHDAELDDILRNLLEAVRDLFGGDAASLLVTDEAGSELLVRAAVGLPIALDAVHIPVGTGFAGRVIATNRRVVVDDVDEIDIASPVLRNSGLGSLMAVPLSSDERAFGVMHVGSRRRAHFTDLDAEQLGLIADRISTALERARLLAAERRAREAAETAQERLAFLSDASRVVGSSLDRDQILTRVASLAVPRLADWCTVYVRDGDHIVRLVQRSSLTGAEPTLQRLRQRNDAPIEPDSRVARVWRTGQAVLVPDTVAEAAGTVPPDIARALADLGLRSSMVVPVVTRGRTAAVMTFGVAGGRPAYTNDDLNLARELAGRVASGLANAALYQREHGVAEALTRAVLPDSLPQVPGLNIAARYRPAGPSVDVGGDWYDAFRIADGRVALVVGDVAGHGLPSAAGMVQLRNGVRAFALDGRPPSEVLERAGALLDASADDMDVIATVVFAFYDPASGEFRWASAGHPPPLLIAPGRAEFLDTTPGPLLGSAAALRCPEHRVTLEPGTGVIMYTDGLVERRDQNIADGLDHLAVVAASLESLEPGYACAHVIDAMTGTVDRNDDSCVLCVHRTP